MPSYPPVLFLQLSAKDGQAFSVILQVWTSIRQFCRGILCINVRVAHQ